MLFWSRRRQGQDLDPHDCTAPDLGPRRERRGSLAKTANKPGYNLFCSGHTFLPDGRLFVAGGHITDSHGEPQASDLRPRQQHVDSHRRHDRRPLVSDSHPARRRGRPRLVRHRQGREQQRHSAGLEGAVSRPWRSIVNFNPPPYFPRMHVVSDGRVFMSGPLPLDAVPRHEWHGNWTFLHPDPNINLAVDQSTRSKSFRDYAPSVLYDDGKILFIGGGNAPTKDVEVLDLNEPVPKWKRPTP